MSIAPRPAPSNDGNKDFLLHLYDALWENMRSKENRLWTFLSLYGAAVGLVFAGGQVSQIPGADLFAIVIVMGLSTWAVLIILNTNWWYYRNQLMVSRIELKYPEAIKGVVPKIYYKNPNYSFDPLSKGSILLLSLLLFFLYARTIWSHHSPASIDSLQSLIVMVLLYVLFVFSVGYCLRLHESNIEAYYGAKRVILEDAAALPLSADEKLSLLADQTTARRTLDARFRVAFLLSLVAGLFDFIFYRNGVSPFWLTITVLFQTTALVMFLVQRNFYLQRYSERDLKLAKYVNARTAGDASRVDELKSVLEVLEDEMKLKRMKNQSRKFWHGAWHMMLLVSISAVITIPTLYRNNLKLQEDWIGKKTVSANDLSEQINKMQQDLQGVQKSFNELAQGNVHLQQRLLDEKLAPYSKRDEADRRFVTREEFNKLIEFKAGKK
jgi:hypothetical protein